MNSLEGKVAIVTAGAGPGMGSAITRGLAAAGAAVMIADIDESAAARVVREIRDGGGQAQAFRTDVANGSDVELMVAATVRGFGAVHILVNHAGVAPGGPIEKMTDAQWDRAVGVHLKSAFLCARAVVPHMKRQAWGRIVSTASRAAYRPMPSSPGLVDYAAAKGGLVSFSRALAMEVGRHGITVNVLAPGLVIGGGMVAGPAPGGDEERAMSEAEGQVLPPRFVRPEEVAGMLLHLVGPQSDRITGQVVHINGGSYFGG